jgi:hypothetical protein
MDELGLRDRLARAEQDIKNAKENFTAFKAEDFGSLKAEVHAMRDEFNKKLDTLLEKVNGINIIMAKWVGAGTVVALLVEFAARKLAG